MSTTIRELLQKTIDAKSYTAAAVAQAINYSESTVSMYLSGKYKANTARIEAAIVPWLRREGVSLAGADDDSDVETRTVQAVRNACTSALEEGLMAAVIGPPGVGKTFALQRWQAWARKERLRFVVITANVHTSAVALLRELGVALGLRDRTAALLLAAIIDKLNREPSMIIVDEAQHLGVKALETIRAIHDGTMTGVVFAGSLQLKSTLEEGDRHSVELAQLQDRIAIVEHVTAMSPLEVSRFVRRTLGVDIVDPQAMEAIREVSHGIPRRLVRLLTHTKRLADGSGKPVSAGMVTEASKRLVAA